MDFKNEAKTFVENITEYVDAKWDLLVLNTGEKVALVVSKLTSWILILAFVLLVFLFLSIGCAILIGQWLGSTSLGFFIMAIMMILVLFLAVKMNKRWIEKSIMSIIAESIKK